MLFAEYKEEMKKKIYIVIAIVSFSVLSEGYTVAQQNPRRPFFYGLYATCGASIIGPGTVGCIGKIEMQPNSSYSIIRDKIKMYSLEGFIGIGIHLRK